MLNAHTGARQRAHTPKLSVAPMMDRTDRHFRYFMRQLTRRTLLYTEMVTMNAILHGDREALLGFSPEEHPLSLQLGGDDPEKLAQCAKIAEDWGYDEVNLNVGCPSDRVQRGRFGACLMAHPDVVARCVEAMRHACGLPVTVKHRIGIDDIDTYEDMARFVDTVAAAGCDRFSIHARKAWLQGLSPKENREVPPLRYDDVFRLKRDRPGLAVELNGGITSLEQAKAHLLHVDGVMIGRAAYENPFLFAQADHELFGDGPLITRHEVAAQMIPYAERWLGKGGRLHQVTRHLLMLFAGRPGAGAWRRFIAENAHLPGAGAETIARALALVPRDPPETPFPV